MKKSGIEIIAEERQRQIESEGWTPEHDSQHTKGQLAILAMLYCCPSKYRPLIAPSAWFKTMNWDFKWWKPTDRIKELAKAGALIAAEIDRLQKLKED